MLDSWTDGAAKSAIVDFVARVTTEGGADYVPPRDRIATFGSMKRSTSRPVRITVVGMKSGWRTVFA